MDDAAVGSIDRDHLTRQSLWSYQTFGPGDRTLGVVDHIRKELDEILEADANGWPTLPEWVDVIILALDGAWRSDATPVEIIAAIKAKQAKNEAREWPDWRTQPVGMAIQHIDPRED